MKAINTKSRRISYLKFVGLLLLALIPICLAVFLFTSVDRIENHFLRNKYSELSQLSLDNDAENQAVSAVLLATEQLKDMCQDRKSQILNFGSLKNSEIEGKLDKLDEKLQELPENKEQLEKSISYMQQSMEIMNEVYTTAYREIDKLRDDLDEARKIYVMKMGEPAPF